MSDGPSPAEGAGPDAPKGSLAHDHQLIAAEVEELAHEVSGTGAVLASEERPSMLDLMGGPLGMAETAIPTIAFVIATTAGAEIATAAVIAVGLAALLALARMVRRQTPQFALAGVIGVGISAFVAHKTGEARGFFLPGLLINVAYAVGALASIAAKHPFVGWVVEGIGGDDMTAWRRDPLKMRAYRLASLVFVGIFLLRVVVQVPLYLADQVVVLGTVRLVMGFPLFGLAIWLSWLIIRQAKNQAESQAETPTISSSQAS